MGKGTKSRMRSLLLELLKDSKRSDRELAKLLGVSQPTVTRLRSRLVREGMIKEFTIIPDLVKMGYTIMAVTCFRAKYRIELIGKAEKWSKEHPSVIFVAGAQGMGKNGLLISLHKDYAHFDSLLSELLVEFGEAIEEHGTLIVNLKGTIVKPLSLAYLAELEET